jgi:hypothetical protein
MNTATTDDARDVLEQLRAILQELDPIRRRAAVEEMPPHVRKDLLVYMSDPAALPSSSASHTKHNNRKRTYQNEAWSRGTDVRTFKRVHAVSYQVQLRLRGLRVYTRVLPDFNTAISHQMGLVRARHAIDAAGENVWDDPQAFSDLFKAALSNGSTSEEEFGLSTFIFMRADEWIGRSTIVSPVVPLEDAVTIHSRLMAARQTSWAKLRDEWVGLMCQTQRAQYSQPAQAEALAEQARGTKLQRQLKRAIGAAERIWQRKEKLAKAVQHRAACSTRLSAKAKVIAQRRLARMRAACRQWYKREDLTTDEMMQGPVPDH